MDRFTSVPDGSFPAPRDWFGFGRVMPGPEQWLVLGSWIARLHADVPEHARLLCDHFRQETVAPASLAGRPHDAEIRLMQARNDDPRLEKMRRVPADSMEVGSIGRDGLQLISPALLATVERGSNGVEIGFLFAGGVSTDVLNIHLTVAIRRILLWLGMLYLHAGTVVWNGAALMFVGEKGAGKTTTCLRLTKEGGLLLSEDHTLVKQGRETLVSGSDRLARILPDAEQYIFGSGLAGASRDFAGTWKKEFAAGDYVRCSHFADYPLERIIFLRVGDALAIRPISTMEGTLRMMTANRSGFRFAAAGDYQEYLDFFSNLTSGKRVYDVTLSRNLEDLTGLVEFVQRA